MIWLLILLLIILFLCAYYYFDSDFFNPTVLFVGGFIAASSVAALNSKTWGVSLSIKTAMIIIISCIAFFLGNDFGNKVRINLRSVPTNTTSSNIEKYSPIYVKQAKYAITALFGLVVLLLQYREVARISGLAISYYQNFGMMTAYKAAVSEGNYISELVQQLLRLYAVATQILTFIFMYNLRFGKKKKRHTGFTFIIIVLYTVQCILQGGRGTLINFFIYIIFLRYHINYLAGRVHRRERHFNSRFFIRTATSIVLFLYVFYAGMGLVGRVSDSSFFNYISSYIGSSVEMLDIYIKNPTINDKPFLGETFPVLINFFKRLGILSGDSVKITLEYRLTDTGLTIGNIYTALRRYYHDLSWGGVIVFPFIMAWFFSYFSKRIRSNCGINNNYVFRCVVYGTLLGTVLLQAMEDSFFLYKITPGYLLELLIIKIVINIYIENRLAYTD